MKFDPEALRAAFARDGYAIVRELLPKAMLAEVARHVEGEILSEAPNVRGRHRIQTTYGFGGAVKMAKVNGLIGTDPLFASLSTRAELIDVVEALLGRGARRFRDVLIVKPPHSPGAFSYHQDSAYWDVEPKALVSAWVALGDVSEHASCLRVVPGSHRTERPHHLFVGGRVRIPALLMRALRAVVSLAGTGDAPEAAGGDLRLWRLKNLVLTHATRYLPFLADLGDYRVDPREMDGERELALPVRSGDVIFFHSLLLHASGPNESSVPRYASIISFMSVDARFVGTGTPSFPPARPPA